MWQCVEPRWWSGGLLDQKCLRLPPINFILTSLRIHNTSIQTARLTAYFCVSLYYNCSLVRCYIEILSYEL